MDSLETCKPSHLYLLRQHGLFRNMQPFTLVSIMSAALNTNKLGNLETWKHVFI